jgi:hypothetical protein
MTSKYEEEEEEEVLVEDCLRPRPRATVFAGSALEGEIIG